jgi:hypothetical protein
VIVLASLACLTHQALGQACFNFVDTFSPPSSLWSNLRGGWTASNGEYYASVPSNNPTTHTTLPYDFRDFTLTVTAHHLADGGVWMRTDPAGQNGMLLVLGGGGYGQGWRGGAAGTTLYTHRVINGNYSSPIGVVNNIFSPGSDYTIRVRVVGTQYSVYINGSTTPAVTFNDSTYSHGLVGLYDDQPNIAAGGSGPTMTFSDLHLNGNLVECACAADFNHDGTIDFFDYLDFVDAFSQNFIVADYNGDDVIDFFDYLDFVDFFSAGC